MPAAMPATQTAASSFSPASGGFLDLAAFRKTPLQRDPYEHLIVPGFVPADRLKRVIADFPDLEKPGSFAPADLNIHGGFAALLKEMKESAFRQAVEEKFSLTLKDRPVTFTVRGRCHRGDGKIHTDSISKIITVLLYLNDRWEESGGRLRILRSGHDLNDFAGEVIPDGGTLLIFRRSPCSWHGHEPFEGRRRSVQMNWVTDQQAAARGQRRHRLSAAWKMLASAWR